MFNSKHNTKCVWVLMLISLTCLANARQIRYNRYNKEVIEDVQYSEDDGRTDRFNNNQIMDSENGIQATVREVQFEPYPDNSNRSMRASNGSLARREQNNFYAQVTDEALREATTETIEFITTTQLYETNNLNVEQEESIESSNSRAPYPAAGFKPNIRFILPTEHIFENTQNKQQNDGADEGFTEPATDRTNEMINKTDAKAPYPAAGYRPSKAFLLPSEQLQLENEQIEKFASRTGNSNHPPCGSSTNPLAPKPINGAKEDPNSESIFVNTQDQQKPSVITPVRYSIQP